MIFKTMIHLVDPLVQRILTHPFNQTLAEGTLSQQTFIYYLQQDALFLNDFSKALALVAARLPAPFSGHILKFAVGAVEAEQQLHRNYLKAKTLTHPIEKNTACFMYTNYILKTSSLGSVEEAVASLVPCFWIYHIVGEHIAASQATPNPFHAWIDTYSSESFQHVVSRVIEMMNVLAESASDKTQHDMLSAFKCATELEWLFWDEAYHEAPTLSKRIG